MAGLFDAELTWPELLQQSRQSLIPHSLRDAMEHEWLPRLVSALSTDPVTTDGSRFLTTDELAKILTLCRNCCACAEWDMAKRLMEHDVLGLLLQYCRQLTLMSNVNSDENCTAVDSNQLDPESKLRLANLIAQLFANCSAASLIACDRIVREHRSQLVDLLALCLSTGNRRCVSCAIAVLYNCICSAKAGASERLSLLLQERLLFCQVILAMYQQPQLSTTSEQRDNTRKHDAHSNEEDDPVVEWISLLMVDVVKQQKEAVLYSLVQSTADAVFTLEQMTVLYLFVSLGKDVHPVDVMTAVSIEDQSHQSIFHCVASQLQLILPRLRFYSEDESTTNPMDSVAEQLQRQTERDFAITAMEYLSQILCLAMDCKEIRPLLSSQYALVVLLCQMLRRSRTLSAETESDNALINAVLQLLGNCIYRCIPAQDEFLEEEGVAVVLGMCATNVRQPLRREWALLCIRHACETNERIRSFIDSLQLQEARVVNERLRESDMQVDIDSATGKLRFVSK